MEWIFYGILILLLMGNVALAFMGTKYRKLLQIERKVSLQYEKKFHQFRLRYTILACLEKEEKIIANIKLMNCPIYIYGRGILGEKLKKMIEREETIEFIEIFEKKDLEMNASILDHIKEDAKIILTPMYDYNNIIHYLEKYVSIHSIVGIDELM